VSFRLWREGPKGSAFRALIFSAQVGQEEWLSSLTFNHRERFGRELKHTGGVEPMIPSNYFYSCTFFNRSEAMNIFYIIGVIVVVVVVAGFLGVHV
jgi:hypothetical protein